ncbi:hypothetical protein Golomagni_02216 [Golovinomyces magnicellulatus]|nr:hypothetical protein Golomagni_02216 [Golovinomyces magnicellulatus]
MYSILISLCIAALFCNTLTQAADKFGILDVSEPYAASLPVSEEFNPVPSSLAISAEVPDTAIYHSEDLEASISTPPLESNPGTSPQRAEIDQKTEPYLGSNETAEDENSDPTYVSSSSYVVSTTTIYQAISSDSKPTATYVENPKTTVMPTTNDGEVRGKFGTDDGLPGSTPGNISYTEVTETSSISSTMYTMTSNETTSVQPSLSTIFSSASQAETTTAIANSSYVSITTSLSSVSETVPNPETTTSLFNSSTSQTFITSTPTTASSSEATIEVPSSTSTSPTQSSNPTNTTSSSYTDATSKTLMPSTPANISSSDATVEFPSSTLSSSDYYSPTNTTSIIYSEPTSIESLSSGMSIPSVTPSSSSGSLNYSIPSTTSSDTSSPSPTEPSSLPGNSSTTAYPDTSSLSPTEPSSLPGNSSTTAYPDTSSLSPTEPSSFPGNSSTTASETSTNTRFSPTSNSTTSLSPGSSPITIPYQSATQLPNTTYTALPSNSGTIGSSSQTETLSITSSLTKVMPTATNTGSTFIPSSIIAQTSSSYSIGQTTSTSTGIPSSLPKIVQNPMSSSSPSQPEDTAEIQIGFQWELNYPFVVGHPLSTSQIFTYLPIGIADGLGLNSEQIVVKNLFPLDTTEELNYITTVARVFIPASMVDTLRIDLGISASPIYQNDDDSVRTLMNFINPAIPYFPGTVMQHGASSSVTASQSTSTPSSNAGVFNTETQQPQSASAKGTTAGIALAACGGAAAYGAAMFLLARRYKHRQQQQQHPNRPRSLETTSSSIESAESNVEYGNESALMSGGRISNSHDRHSRGSGRTGYSARTAQISGPMMSENSLGWT